MATVFQPNVFQPNVFQIVVSQTTSGFDPGHPFWIDKWRKVIARRKLEQVPAVETDKELEAVKEQGFVPRISEPLSEDEIIELAKTMLAPQPIDDNEILQAITRLEKYARDMRDDDEIVLLLLH